MTSLIRVAIVGTGFISVTPVTRDVTPTVTLACARAERSLEAAWRVTGEWRRLAPFPVPREASPTDSLGVWLERRQQPDGSIELHRVSLRQTTVASFAAPGCGARITTHRRGFAPVSLTHALTDDEVRTLVRSNAPGMIYVWSPRMPLSISGLAEARAAARELGMMFTAVVADSPAGDSGEVADASVDAEFTRRAASIELVYRNATIHYPTAIFYRDGRMLDAIVPGFKHRETYVMLAHTLLANDVDHVTAPAIPLPPFWVDHSARVTTISTVRTVRPVGFFFKPVAHTNFVSYTSGKLTFLFDLVTREERRLPGWVDPVATPDGRFITLPGFAFFERSTVLAGDTTPMLLDRELPDEYQTASVVRESPSTVRYRATTGWRASIRVREYEAQLNADGRARRVEAVSAPSVPCPEEQFALPISAKFGREVGVFDMKTKTNRVILPTSDGRCTPVLDLGFATGKLAFSYDGSAIAFASARINLEAEGDLLLPDDMFYKDALVLYRKTNRIVAVASNRSVSGMSFPEFLLDGKIIVLDQASRVRPNEVIRVVEVK